MLPAPFVFLALVTAVVFFTAYGIYKADQETQGHICQRCGRFYRGTGHCNVCCHER